MSGKLTIQALCGLSVSPRSIFDALKEAKVIVRIIGFYVGLPFARRLMPRNTFMPRSIAFRNAEVGHVLKARGLSEVAPSVVRAIAINMVDLAVWPFSGHNGPCDTIGSVPFTFHTNYYSPIVPFSSGKFADLGFLAGRFLPAQMSVFRCVCEYFGKLFWRVHQGSISNSRSLSIGGCYS